MENANFFYWNYVSQPQVDPPVVCVLFAVSQTALAETKKETDRQLWKALLEAIAPQLAAPGPRSQLPASEQCSPLRRIPLSGLDPCHFRHWKRGYDSHCFRLAPLCYACGAAEWISSSAPPCSDSHIRNHSRRTSEKEGTNKRPIDSEFSRCARAI